MLAFVTLTGNEAEERGGGIGEARGVRMRDTIVDGNAAPTGANCLEGPVSEGGNVADPACGLSHVTDAPVFDPVVGPLQGFPIPVLEPLPGSPALDRAVGACPPEDARGVPRPQGSACDTGAAERPVPVSEGGTGTPPPPLAPGPVPPVLSALTVHPSSLVPDRGRGASIAGAKTKRGATVSYGDSQTAVTTLTVLSPRRGYRVGRTCRSGRPRRHRGALKRCTRYVSLGSFSHTDVAGSNGFHFTGRMRGKPLPAGRYRLAAVARNAAGEISRPVTADFHVIR